ncbi:MAG: transglutaminase-like domain-containing protein [Candidatus Gracilibacteria bacterium]|jgi:hypothetical protein
MSPGEPEVGITGEVPSEAQYGSPTGIPATETSEELTPVGAGRRAILSYAALAAALAMVNVACGKASQEPAHAAPAPAPVQNVDPNRPEFLDEDTVRLTGLTFMMANNDQFDRYIFNAVTGNRSHAQTLQVEKGYEFDLVDGRKFTMPYHSFLFKPFDKRSNVNLPKRIGTVTKDQGLATFFRQYTKYRADNPKDIQAIKTILITSYDLSFGVKLDPEYIQIEGDGSGRIKAIKYTASDARTLKVSTVVATETAKYEHDPEARYVVSDKKKEFNLVGKEGELIFPPSFIREQGIVLPHSAMLEYPSVKYTKTFTSQGRTIGIDMNIPVDEVLDDQKKLDAQNSPKYFATEADSVVANLGYYIVENDPLTKALAELITKEFTTKREKMQAIMDFIHSYDYVPDAYGEAPKTTRVTLISKGGDCEDSTILAVALARAVGIDGVFVYFDGHTVPACDIGERGTAFTWSDGKYEWCETTGGQEGVVALTRWTNPDGRIVKTDRSARPWGIGENSRPDEPIKFVSRVEDKTLTRFGQ